MQSHILLPELLELLTLPINNKSAFGKVLERHQIYHKPLPDPMLTQVYAAMWCHLLWDNTQYSLEAFQHSVMSWFSLLSARSPYNIIHYDMMLYTAQQEW